MTVVANEIFISYRRSDEPRARLFYNLLKERGVEAWYDAKIQAGEDWRTTTANALDAAPIFVLLMSKLASESGDIAKELAAATHKRKLVVPVRLDDMQLEGVFLYELASRNWINAFKDTEARLAELADKLAALVKSDLSPEAAAALEVNVAELAAIKGAKAKSGGRGFAALLHMQKGGSVAVLTSAAVAIVAAVGAGAWLLKGPAKADAEATSIVASMATAGSPEGITPAAMPAGAVPEAPKLTLAAALTEATTAAKEAARSETEIAALTEASTRVAALADRAAAGDAAAQTEMNDIALAAARAQTTALAADPVIASVKGDFKTAASESKASGAKMDAQLVAAIEESDAAQAAIKTAVETAAGTDADAAVAAMTTAQKSVFKLIALKPVANDAYIKAKRQSYASNSAAARTMAGQIAQLAGMKKPGVFASSERKEAYKYVVATDAWARSRVAEIDMLASSVTSADRKAAAKYASQAATARTELQTALANVKTEAAKAAAN